MKKIVMIGLITCSGIHVNKLAAQEEDHKLHVTTGVGVNKIQGSLRNTFRSTVAFNSGFEKKFGHNWYGQLEANFNALKYDQQAKDENSDFLFQNTSSSFFMIGVNGGYDFPFGNSPWFGSLYAGGGFLNIGEPRVTVDETNNIVTQDIVRKPGAFGKGGGRIGVKTNSELFQTIYIDGSWLTSSLKIQEERFRSVSVFIGIRMAMTNKNKTVKKQRTTVRLMQ